MELAPRNKELYENRSNNEFPLIKKSPFDAEFDSASIGASFNDGKTFGENPEIFVFYIGISKDFKRDFCSLERFPVDRN